MKLVTRTGTALPCSYADANGKSSTRAEFGLLVVEVAERFLVSG